MTTEFTRELGNSLIRVGRVRDVSALTAASAGHVTAVTLTLVYGYPPAALLNTLCFQTFQV